MSTVPTPRRTSPPAVLRAALASVALALSLAACDNAATNYPASTPDEALDSAHEMVISGDADRLTDLVYADSDEMRSFLNQTGSLLASLQRLGEAVEQRFPEELAEFRAEAERAAAEGKTNPLLARLVAAGRGSSRNPGFGVSQIDREGLTLDSARKPDADSSRRRRRRSNPFGGAQSDSQREIVNDIIKQFLADPYRWLENGRDRLGTVYIADDTVALTWDGKPILPPFGLSMIEEKGRWFLVPPTAYPGVSTIMPRNADEWFVWGSMIKTLERVAIDLEQEVRSGRVRNMTDLADTAAEKVAIPAMLVFFAYGNLVEERKKQADQAAAGSREQQNSDDKTEERPAPPDEPTPDANAPPGSESQPAEPPSP